MQGGDEKQHYNPDGCAKSYTKPPVSSAALAKQIKTTGLNQPDDHSGFYLAHEGLTALAARIALIEESEVSLDLQYYIFSDDISGRMLMAKLLDAAERGVRVRLLVDDLGTRIANPWIGSLDNHENIEVRVFNPVEGKSGLRHRLKQVFNLGRINHRMHNKLLLADSVAMVTGGRNISDGYFVSADCAFLDVDVLAIGPIVTAASETFDDYWNHPISVPIAELALGTDDYRSLMDLNQHLVEHKSREASSELHKSVRESDFREQLLAGRINFDWGAATLFADPPQKATSPEETPIEDYPGYQLAQIISGLRLRLEITNAYLIPGEPGIKLFNRLVDRGVSVRILTNGMSSTDTAMVHGAYSRYRKPLLRAGGELWELKPSAEREGRLPWFNNKSQSTLHAKTFVLDQNRSFVGSINLDSRSMTLNTEIGVLIDNRDINGQLHKLFEDWTAPDSAWKLSVGDSGSIHWHGMDEHGSETIKRRDPNSTLWQRFLCGILAHLPVESQI